MQVIDAAGKRNACGHVTVVILLSAIGVRADDDPSLVAKAQPEQKDLTVKDEKRSREIPVRIYLPADKAVSPVVLFSHGLGGNREGSAFLGKHWALRGYAAVFLQHPGSDDSVWKNKPVAERMAALKQAAGLKDLERPTKRRQATSVRKQITMQPNVRNAW